MQQREREGKDESSEEGFLLHINEGDKFRLPYVGSSINIDTITVDAQHVGA